MADKTIALDQFKAAAENIRISLQATVPATTSAGIRFRVRYLNPPDPPENVNHQPGIFRIQGRFPRKNWLGLFRPFHWVTVVALPVHVFDGPSIMCAIHPEYPMFTAEARLPFEAFAHRQGVTARMEQME